MSISSVLLRSYRFQAQADKDMASTAADRRRFQGPETSSPIRFIKPADKGKQPERHVSPLVHAETGLREDDRAPEDIRPICMSARAGMHEQAADCKLLIFQILQQAWYRRRADQRI